MNSTRNTVEKINDESQLSDEKQEDKTLPIEIADNEFLFRGVVKPNWDLVNNRVTSAAFKDSGGASVDRDGGGRNVNALKNYSRQIVLSLFVKSKQVMLEIMAL